jgi:hypothetical protein
MHGFRSERIAWPAANSEPGTKAPWPHPARVPVSPELRFYINSIVELFNALGGGWMPEEAP